MSHQRPIYAAASSADPHNDKPVETSALSPLRDLRHLEDLARFNRAVIPERGLHAKGTGAFGTFTLTADMSRYTKAAMLAQVGTRTGVFVRFSLVSGERGSAETDRDVRGFAVRFHTAHGHWDIVGNNTPVFFTSNPSKFTELSDAIKRDPITNLRSLDRFWRFVTSSPESLHQVTILMSERGIPASYRHLHGFGGHTFSFINAANERFWVKFHFISQQGIRTLSDQEAAAVSALDRDSAQRDLFTSIANGDFPKWTMKVQLMPERAAAHYHLDPFDLTKVWPHKDFPLIEVGVLELNRNPDHYFSQVEQAAFTPANVVPGVSFSPDRMLQSRLFAYGDAHRYRLGAAHRETAVNAQRCPHDAGLHAPAQGQADSPAEQADDTRRVPLHREDDPFAQPGALFRLMNRQERQRLFENTARALQGIPREIQQRHIDHCHRADRAYGLGLVKALANT